MKKSIFILSSALLISISCKKNNNQDASDYLNENVGLPAGTFDANIDTLQVDSTISLINTSGSDVAPVTAGQTMTISIPFTAPNANVVGAAIQFGNSGLIHMVPIAGANGNASGTLTFQARVPADICDNLSSICHQIKCYEYAITSIGKISKTNINNIAVLCGNCTEPTCVGLVDCSTDSSFVGSDGSPRFNLRFTNSTNVDLDLHVKDPSGEEIYYSSQTSASGGTLDVDCACGDCTNGPNENIYWLTGPNGTYEYWVEYYEACSSPGASSSYTLTVTKNGTVITTKTGTLSSGSSTHFTFTK